MSIDFHNLSVNACFSALKSKPAGLTFAQAEKTLKHNGPNELPKEKVLGAHRILLRQFNNPLIYILIFTAVLSVITAAEKEAAVIVGAVLINVIIGFIQENKANRSITKLRQLVEHKAYIIRDGNETMVDSASVVVGDVIMINTGNRIPADARVFEAVELLVDEAMLTGESIPSHKRIDDIPKGAALADRENMVYSGTIVVSGVGKAVVTATGSDTQIGQIAEMVKVTEEEKTPLQLRLTKFSKFLGLMFGIICILIIGIGIWQGRPLGLMLETGVALGVASIPEGLIVAVTFILALGMQRILKEKALTRKLVAAETLGSTTVICSDKTGTLTEGKMQVAHIVIGEHEYDWRSPGTRQDPEEAQAVSMALQIGMMCNTAMIENPEDELHSWRFIGSPTEVALLSAAIQSGLNRKKLSAAQPRFDEMPFDSDRKFMLSLRHNGLRKYLLYEKGAPEILLSKAKKYLHSGSLRPLGTAERARLDEVYEALTKRGLRVIGLAKRELAFRPNEDHLTNGNMNWEEVDCDLDFIGFIALKDPLRQEAKETISIAQAAGIRTIIITGDHPLTAKAIAREVGLKTKRANVIVGEKLNEINDDELIKLSRTIDIYARVSPRHKLRIINALKKNGDVVAMTGDGINDSPALKAADIGISFGTGTDIAKETSDIVLLDNNFKTIVSAIRQGRIIYRNIQKVITYLISDSFTEIILVVGSIIFGTPLAILPAQILWINIINDGLPHFSLAFERGQDNIMTEPPINKDQPLLDSKMKAIIFGVGLIRDFFLFFVFYMLWWHWRESSEMLQYIITFIFATLGVKSLATIYSIRNLSQPIWHYNPFSNRYLNYAVGASLILLLAGIYWPPINRLLSTVPLGLWAWLLILLIVFFNLFLIEFVKIIFNVNYRRNRRHAL